MSCEGSLAKIGFFTAPPNCAKFCGIDSKAVFKSPQKWKILFSSVGMEWLYNAFNVPTTTSFAKTPVAKPTVAGQFSCDIPMGAKSGVMVRPTCDKRDCPCTEIEFSIPINTQMGTIYFPARHTNPFNRCHA